MPFSELRHISLAVGRPIVDHSISRYLLEAKLRDYGVEFGGHKLSSDRCVTESLTSQLTPPLKTNVSVTWSHLRPRTCDAVSGLIAVVKISLLSLALVLEGFSFKDKLGTLLIIFNRLNPPNLSNSTELRFNNKAVSGYFHRAEVVIHVKVA